MAKRIKKVFGSSDQVLHLWANQSQSEARSSNVFFEGDTVYSYGYHYKLGQIVKYKGKTVALINTDGYSVTTSKHISQAMSATRHLLRVSVSKDFDIEKAIKLQKANIESELQSHFKRLKFSKHDTGWNYEFCSERNSIAKHNALCESLKLSKYKVKVTPKYIRDYNAHIQARLKRDAELNTPEAIAKREAKREAAAQRKYEKELEKAANEIPTWRAGGPITNAVRNLDPQLIRVKGDYVETSRGASVPLSEAKELLSKIVRATAKTGDKVGSFNLDRVNGNVVTIGCHNIDLNEAKAVLNPLRIVKEA